MYMLFLITFFLVDDFSNANPSSVNQFEWSTMDSLKTEHLLDSIKAYSNLDSIIHKHQELQQKNNEEFLQYDSLTKPQLKDNMPIVKPKTEQFMPSAKPDSTKQHHLLIKDKSPLELPEKLSPEKEEE